ncbi:hypothetical protein MATL_G00146160 [Megalops atlanticus]|uniref:Uncharacterized protein n=1 Tax=Megalops atlanticus TaxID=7932 RepID=A0A9D3PVQ7_MEGAT|nr:hypothetical protein MATL_G00146160 [Megalops atlanticus]
MFDDRHVKRASQDSVLQQRERSAYLLFYEYSDSTVRVESLSEEEQLEMAIKLSLQCFAPSPGCVLESPV